MKKRLLCLTLCLLLVLPFCLAACSNSNADEDLAEINKEASKNNVSLTMWVVSEKEINEQTAKRINDAINVITKKNLSTQLRISFLTEDQYKTTLDSTIAAYEQAVKNGSVPKTDENLSEAKTELDEYGLPQVVYPEFLKNQVDIIYIAGKDMYCEYVDKGWLKSMKEELEGASKKIKEYLPETLLNAVKYQPKDAATPFVYAIPNNFAVGSYTVMLLNKSLMEETSMDGKYLDGKIDGFFNDAVYLLAEDAKGKNDPNVIPIASSYDDCLNLLNHYYPSGTDVTKTEGYSKLAKYKDESYFGTEGEGKTVAVKFVDCNITEYEDYLKEESDYYPVILKYPEATAEEVCENMFGVCSYTRDFSRSMQVVTYLSTNKEFRNLLQYGEEGVDYKLVNDEDGNIFLKFLEDDYRMDVRKTGNAFLAYLTEGQDPDLWKEGIRQNEQSKNESEAWVKAK